MRLKLRRIWLAALLVGGLVMGCERAAVRPQDPLLISKKPIEGTAQGSKPSSLAYNEPAPPPIPATALVSAPSHVRSLDAERGGYRADVVTFGKPLPASQFRTADATSTLPPAGNSNPAQVKAIPALRSGFDEMPAVTAQRRQVSGPYGHSADYAWLQGILDKHYQGHFSLRFCDPTVDDQWGGKVHLEQDTRLAQFKEGDVVMVDGEFSRDANGQVARGLNNHYPRYRIRNITLIQSSEPPEK